jgi:putative peptide zinc metalloprotease protein
LLKRRGKEARQKWLRVLTSVLAWRFPGVDPDRFLTWMYPKVRWFFTTWFFAAFCILLSSAALLVLRNFDEVQRRLPEFYQFFGFQNLLMMSGILIVTKSLHELGHGMMCKHFGGECHEIGFMLLVLTPAMYCNTSDSWILPNKWHRIAIGAAGMYVELVLAGICTWIWFYSQPGWLNHVALNIVFLCSVSTVMFNANPLLRYDGYYMLADLLEIPNLSQKSQLSLINRLRTICLGMDPVPSRFLPERNQSLFAAYSVASFAYRWFVYFSIMWFLTKVFEPYGLEILGYSMIAFSLVGMVLVPAFKLVKFFKAPGRWRQVKKPRLIISLAVGAAILAAIAMIRVPHHIYAPFVVRADQAEYVYVMAPGNVQAIHVQPGQRVEAGTPLITLDDPDMRLSLEQLRGEKYSLTREIEAREKMARTAVEMAREIGKLQAKLASVTKQIELLEANVAKLRIASTTAGVVYPPPEAPRSEDVAQPVAWSRTPLDQENLGALLPQQTLVCVIGEPRRMRAVLLLEQSDVQFVRGDQPVQLILDEFRDLRLGGTVTSISRNQLAELPSELSTTHGGPVGGAPSPSGQERPQLTYFEAFVPLHNLEVPLTPGFRGIAKIRVEQASLGWRLLRLLRTVFYFR